MRTLLSDAQRHNGARRGWVFYDGDCTFCTSLARRFEPMLLRRGFHCAALQEPWVSLLLGLSREELLTELRVRTTAGKILGGADALIHVARHIWWAWPIFALAQIPSPRDLFRAAYRWLALRRHCLAVSPHVSGNATTGKGASPCQ
jgi:predicted DCC family thiol-disulfide oxidoreductase YuxK